MMAPEFPDQLRMDPQLAQLTPAVLLRTLGEKAVAAAAAGGAMAHSRGRQGLWAPTVVTLSGTGQAMEPNRPSPP